MIRRTGVLGTVMALALTADAWCAGATPVPVAAWADSLGRAALATGLTPGLQAAIVVGDRTVWQGCFGVADREERRAVAPGTRFYIASTTKAFTALATARLADRGALDLDAPLARALPGAVFADGVAGDSIRVRDLLTHTHGIDPEGPVSLRVAYTGDYTNAELLRLLAYHHAARTGRAFAYSNLGYDLVGVVLAPAVTRGWREVVAHEVIDPLGMRATTAWRSRVPDHSLAEPYEMGSHGLERVPLAKDDANMGPAGGLFSTASDLARLLIAELNAGRVDHRTAIEPEAIAATQRQQVAQDHDFTYFHRFGWGLGWDLGTYGSDTLLHRFGSFAGYRSHVSFMPRRGIGVVVLANGGQASSRLCDALACAIYDRLFGRGDAAAREQARLDSLRAEAARYEAGIAAARAERAARQRALPLPMSAYAGTYVSPTLGTLRLALADGGLIATMGVARSPAEVFDADKNQLRVELFGGGSVLSAVLSSDGHSVDAVELLDQRFVRRPGAGRSK